MCISDETRSVNLPLPSSPHWVPTTTVAGTHLSVRSALRITHHFTLPETGVRSASCFTARRTGVLANWHRPAVPVPQKGGPGGGRRADRETGRLRGGQRRDRRGRTGPALDSVVDAGARAELVAVEAGLARTLRHLTPVTRFPVDRTTEEARVDDFDGVVLPGGVVNADRLRGDA